MFRMEVRSQVWDDEDDGSGHSINESVYQPAIFEGRVGRFGKVHRVSSQCDSSDRLVPKKSRVLTHDGGLENWREAELINSDYCAPCLQGVTQDEATQQAIFFDARVLRELVRPFAADLQRSNPGNAEESTSSISSGSDSSFRSELSSASEGSVAELNVLQRERKAWEEPLLALHQQAEVELRAANEAKLEAKRLAEEEALESARRQRELQDLANCVDSYPRRGSFKKNKIQKVLRMTRVKSICRFLRNPFGLLKAPKVHNAYVTRAAVDAAVRPRRTMTGYTPSCASLAQMESAPAHQEIQFAMVNSIQRAVPAWTMEEYMTRNCMIQNWKRRQGDVEFGGGEGKNWHLGNRVQPTYDSDSD